MLAKCYRSCLALAVESKLDSIAFPAISTGAFAYPIAEACRVAAHECAAFLENAPSLERIILVAFDETDAALLRQAVREATS